MHDGFENIYISTKDLYIRVNVFPHIYAAQGDRGLANDFYVYVCVKGALIYPQNKPKLGLFCGYVGKRGLHASSHGGDQI